MVTKGEAFLKGEASPFGSSMLLAVTDKSKGSLGMSTILVEKAVSPWEAKELHKIGWRCFPTGEMYFTDCRVPKINIVMGDIASGYKRTMQEFEVARSGMQAM